MSLTHGHFVGGKRPTGAYRTWIEMRRRCRAPEGKVGFSNYSGRGIRVCKRWQSFENFLADMGERPPGASIERIDNGRGYEPSNCRWATTREQGRNRRTNETAVYRGQRRTLIEWAEFANIPYQAFWRRVRGRGWSIARAIETPLMSQFSRVR